MHTFTSAKTLSLPVPQSRESACYCWSELVSNPPKLHSFACTWAINRSLFIRKSLFFEQLKNSVLWPWNIRFLDGNICKWNCIEFQKSSISSLLMFMFSRHFLLLFLHLSLLSLLSTSFLAHLSRSLLSGILSSPYNRFSFKRDWHK